MPEVMRSPNFHKGRVFEQPQGYATPVTMWKTRPVMPKFRLLEKLKELKSVFLCAVKASWLLISGKQFDRF